MTPLDAPFSLGRRFQSLERLGADVLQRPVWRAFDTRERTTVVIKGVVAPLGASAHEALRSEFLRLRTLPHPLLVPALDFLPLLPVPDFYPTEVRTDERQRLSIFTQPFVRGPSLRTLSGRLEPRPLSDAFIALLQGVAWLHHCGVTRLDLKPEHLILEGTRWVLIDLDQASLDQPLAPLEHYGTLTYLAPECFDGVMGGPAADLYSVGAMLYEALCGTPPPCEPPSSLEVGRSLEQLGAWLRESPVPLLPAHFHQTAPEAAQLAEALLARSPGERPSAEQALQRLGFKDSWRYHSPLPSLANRVRTELLDSLHRTLEQPSLLGLTGAPGSGRTFTLQCLHTRLQLQGISTLRLSPLDTPEPDRLLGVFEDWLTDLIAEPPAETSHYSALVPPKREEVEAPREHAVSGCTPEEAQRRHSQRREDWLKRLTHRIGLLAPGQSVPVVLLDDPEALDPFCADLLLSLARGACEGVLSWVWAGEVSGFTSVPLLPLTVDEIYRLARAVLGEGGLDLPACMLLHERTHGEADGTIEVLRACWRAPKWARQSWQAIISRPPDSALPPVCQLEPPSAQVMQLLSVLAIFDEPFSETLVSSVLESYEPEGDEGVDLDAGVTWDGMTLLSFLEVTFRYAESVGILQRIPAEGWRFARARVKGGLYQALPVTVRAGFHGLIANALETRRRSLPPGTSLAQAMSLIEKLGQHHLASATPARAQAALLEVIDAALQKGDLERAIARLRLWRHYDPQMPLEHLQQLADLEYQQGHFQEALEGYVQICQRCRAGSRRWRVARGGYGAAQLSLRVYAEAEAALTEAVSPGPEMLRMPLEAQIDTWHRLAWLYLVGSPPRVTEAFAALDAAAACQIAPDSVQAIKHQNHRAWAEAHLKDPTQRGQRRQRLEANLLKARAIHDYPGELETLNHLVRLAREDKALPLAIEYAEACIQSARKRLDLRREAVGHFSLSVLLQDMRRFDEAYEHLERAERLYSCTGDATGALKMGLKRAEVLLAAGRRDRAALVLQKATGDLALLPQEDEGLKSLHASLQATLQATSKAEQLIPPIPPPPPPIHGRLMQAQMAQCFTEMLKLLEVHDDEGKLCSQAARLMGELYEGRGFLHLKFAENSRPTGYGLDVVEVSELCRRVLPLVYDSGKPMECAEVQLDSRLRGVRTLRSANARSLICVPVRGSGGVIGALYLDHLLPGRFSDPQTLLQVEEAASVFGRLLESRPGAGIEALYPDDDEELCNLLVGVSPAMRQLRARAQLYARSSNADQRVLILGPPGVGKSLFVKAVKMLREREASALRQQSPGYFAYNCAAVPRDLEDSTFFGIEKGIATAVHPQEGWLKPANGSLLFLDEFGCLSMSLQEKLLRVLEEHEFMAVGGNKKIPFHARVFFGTNAELEQMVKEGRMRTDLLDRIQKNVVKIPPLRERREDTPWLLRSQVWALLKGTATFREVDLNHHFSSTCLRLLQDDCEWPANVRGILNFFENEEIRGALAAGTRIDYSLAFRVLREIRNLPEALRTQSGENPNSGVKAQVVGETEVGETLANKGHSHASLPTSVAIPRPNRDKVGAPSAPASSGLPEVRQEVKETRGSRSLSATSTPSAPLHVRIPNGVTLHELHQWFHHDVKRLYIDQVLDAHRGNITQAAKALGCNRTSLHAVLKEDVEPSKAEKLNPHSPGRKPGRQKGRAARVERGAGDVTSPTRFEGDAVHNGLPKLQFSPKDVWEQ